MKTMKTSELTGAALDWAVAKCEGEDSIASCYYTDDDIPLYLEEAPQPTWEPSTDWAQAGPIIEREKIAFMPDEASRDWLAEYPFNHPQDEPYWCGPTPLIAAMRCYVASKLGDEVEIPEGLE